MKKVLLVDDDIELSQSLMGLFDPDKYSFHHLDDGQETTSYVSTNEDELDLVMLDVNLPSCSGLDLLRSIKSISKDLPVIVISGFISTENAMEAMPHGSTPRTGHYRHPLPHCVTKRGVVVTTE